MTSNLTPRNGGNNNGNGASGNNGSGASENETRDELVSAYLDGELSAADRALVEDSPELLEQVARFRELSQQLAVPPAEVGRTDIIAAALDEHAKLYPSSRVGADEAAKAAAPETASQPTPSRRSAMFEDDDLAAGGRGSGPGGRRTGRFSGRSLSLMPFAAVAVLVVAGFLAVVALMLLNEDGESDITTSPLNEDASEVVADATAAPTSPNSGGSGAGSAGFDSATSSEADSDSADSVSADSVDARADGAATASAAPNNAPVAPAPEPPVAPAGGGSSDNNDDSSEADFADADASPAFSETPDESAASASSSPSEDDAGLPLLADNVDNPTPFISCPVDEPPPPSTDSDNNVELIDPEDPPADASASAPSEGPVAEPDAAPGDGDGDGVVLDEDLELDLDTEVTSLDACPPVNPSSSPTPPLELPVPEPLEPLPPSQLPDGEHTDELRPSSDSDTDSDFGNDEAQETFTATG